MDELRGPIASYLVGIADGRIEPGDWFDGLRSVIERAGCTVVPIDRYERLVNLGTMAAGLNECATPECGLDLCDIVRAEASAMQIRGDLDPAEGAS